MVTYLWIIISLSLSLASLSFSHTLSLPPLSLSLSISLSLSLSLSIYLPLSPIHHQVVQESLPIPGTSLHLVHHSSESPGYQSLILVQLTSDPVPTSLAMVHLQVSVQGSRYVKTFEADPNLKYTFAWDRLNAYKQKVYGIVTATGIWSLFLLYISVSFSFSTSLCLSFYLSQSLSFYLSLSLSQHCYSYHIMNCQ